MKRYPWNFKLRRNGIQWYQTEVMVGSDRYAYYFKWDLMDQEMRDALLEFKQGPFGLIRFWYDCPHAQLNLYYVCFYWSTPWTKAPEGF